MVMKLLFLSNALDHPLTSRMHFFINFLEEKRSHARIFDVSFYYENQNFFKCIKNFLTFPSTASIISNKTFRLPSLVTIGQKRDNIRPFLNFLYSILAPILVRIATKSLDYNVMVAADPVSAFIALFSRKANTLLVYEDLDYFEDIKTGHIRRKLVSFLERLVLKRANLVISVSEPLLKRAQQLNPNCIVIPNGTNLKSFPRPNKINREPILVYAGSIDEWAGLKLVIEAFVLVKKRIPWARMKIIGDGKEKSALEALVENLSLQDHIVFAGKLPYQQMAELLCNYSVGIAMFKPGKAAIYASPLKLFDYMAAGLPIIATEIGDIGRIMKESKSGFATKWAINEFVKAVEELLTNKDLWLTFHKNGLLYVEKYDWADLFKRWLQEIETRFQEWKLTIRNN